MNIADVNSGNVQYHLLPYKDFCLRDQDCELKYDKEDYSWTIIRLSSKEEVIRFKIDVVDIKDGKVANETPISDSLIEEVKKVIAFLNDSNVFELKRGPSPVDSLFVKIDADNKEMPVDSKVCVYDKNNNRMKTRCNTPTTYEAYKKIIASSSGILGAVIGATQVAVDATKTFTDYAYNTLVAQPTASNTDQSKLESKTTGYNEVSFSVSPGTQELGRIAIHNIASKAADFDMLEVNYESNNGSKTNITLELNKSKNVHYTANIQKNGRFVNQTKNKIIFESELKFKRGAVNFVVFNSKCPRLELNALGKLKEKMQDECTHNGIPQFIVDGYTGNNDDSNSDIRLEIAKHNKISQYRLFLKYFELRSTAYRFATDMEREKFDSLCAQLKSKVESKEEKDELIIQILNELVGCVKNNPENNKTDIDSVYSLMKEIIFETRKTELPGFVLAGKRAAFARIINNSVHVVSSIDKFEIDESDSDAELKNEIVLHQNSVQQVAVWTIAALVDYEHNDNPETSNIEYYAGNIQNPFENFTGYKKFKASEWIKQNDPKKARRKPGLIPKFSPHKRKKNTDNIEQLNKKEEIDEKLGQAQGPKEDKQEPSSRAQESKVMPIGDTTSVGGADGRKLRIVLLPN